MIAVDCRIVRGGKPVEPAFHVEAGGITALFGPSGSGKTTTLNLIAGLLKPQAGRITLGPAVLFDSAQGIDVPVERRRIGYVFQDARLFPHLDVRGNLDYGRRRAGDGADGLPADALIAMLGIEGLLARKPATLSGGETQRVALARALMMRPQALLLDEPLAALDRARRDDIIPYLQRLRRTLAVPIVLVSHDHRDVLRLADHLVLMDQGRVSAFGPIETVAARAEGFGDQGPLTLVSARMIASGDDGLMVEAGNNRIAVSGGDVATAGGLSVGTAVRLIIAADDVVLASAPTNSLSISNQLAGQVLSIDRQAHGLATVRLMCGRLELAARITCASADRLGLAPGAAAWALIKAAKLTGFAEPPKTG